MTGRLVFVDILDGRLYEVVDGQTRLLADLDVLLGAVAPVAGARAGGSSPRAPGSRSSSRRRLDWLARPEDDAPQPRRMNDAVCDPAGRFWAGSMAYDEAPGAGSLYRVDTDGTVTRVLADITITNGPAFTADGRRMYLADSRGRLHLRVRRRPDSGELLDHREFAGVDEARTLTG